MNRTKKRRWLTVGSAMAAAVTALVLTPTAASAADDRPCGSPFWKQVSEGGQTIRIQVQVCPDWSPNNSIPVYAEKDERTTVVGYIHAPGDDWYECQEPGRRLSRFGYTNPYWAHTMADNGNWGWVNEIYFSGGDNDQPDGRLRYCPH